jgi:hypothetical protein
MPRGQAGTAKPVPPGTTYGPWVVGREIERQKNNRRFQCECAGCGTVAIKWLANLTQGKTACLVCVPMAERNLAGREAVIAARRAASQESDEGRVCLTCGEWKPWNRFTADPRRSRGKASNCMDCGHWRTVKTLYGITHQEWGWLLAAQDGRCKLCGEPDTVRLNIDHDHLCHPAGRACKRCIRGMLCRVCNRMLGHVEAKPALAARFSDYLQCRPFQESSQTSTALSTLIM